MKCDHCPHDAVTFIRYNGAHLCAHHFMKYVEKISEVDVDGVEPMMHGHALVNVFREDEVRPSMDREAALANAPASTGDEFLLPKIVEGAES